MAEVIPFRGIYYNANKVSGDDVMSPPYDLITPESRKAFYSKSPYNILRIDFGEEKEGDGETENKYTRARGMLEKWQEEGVLLRGEKPAIYAYRVDYKTKGRAETLRGFFCMVRLEELGSGRIFPHESTHSKPKADRLSLMTVCGANTSPIFSIYNSPGRKASTALEMATAGDPYVSARDADGALHSMWIVDNETAVSAVREDLADKSIFIADGHHRYETALEYKRLRREAENPGQKDMPYDYVLMFLANIADGGLTILPTHRLVDVNGDAVDRLSKNFEVRELPAGSDIEESIGGNRHSFGLYMKDRLYRLDYRGGGIDWVPGPMRELDVVVLHELVLKRVLGVEDYWYEMDKSTARSMVDRGVHKAAFFLNPTTVGEVEEVATASLRMPPKSTYFYPKLLTGFVINSFSGEAGAP